MTKQITAVLALLAGMTFLMMGGGLQGILLPIRADIEGFSAYQVGFIGTGYAVGFTIGCIAVPYLVRRAGHVRTFSTLTALLSVSMLLHSMILEANVWILLRATAGFCFAGCYMVAESWLNERVSNEMRGSLFSIYAIVTMVAMAAGQYILVTADPRADTLFMITAILFALAVVPTAISKAQSPAPLTTVNLDVAALFRNSPAAAVGAFFSGIISSAWTTFGPVFGQQSGMTSAMIATLLALALTGSVVFQFPMGKLSDMIDRRYVMALGGLVGATMGTLMSVLSDMGVYGTLFYVAAIGYGGVIYSIYSITVAHANDHAAPNEFVKVSSGLLLIYGFGAMAGPLMTAQMMDLLGPSGVFTTTTIAHFLFGGYALYRTFRVKRVADKNRTEFQPVPITRAPSQEAYPLDPRAAEAYVLDDDGDLPPMPPPVRVE